MARLSSDLASMEESLEAEARQRRTDQRRSEASVVGPLREEVRGCKTTPITRWLCADFVHLCYLNHCIKEDKSSVLICN